MIYSHTALRMTYGHKCISKVYLCYGTQTQKKKKKNNLIPMSNRRVALMLVTLTLHMFIMHLFGWVAGAAAGPLAG